MSSPDVGAILLLMETTPPFVGFCDATAYPRLFQNHTLIHYPTIPNNSDYESKNEMKEGETIRVYLVRALENPLTKKEEKILALVKEGAIGDCDDSLSEFVI